MSGVDCLKPIYTHRTIITERVACGNPAPWICFPKQAPAWSLFTQYTKNIVIIISVGFFVNVKRLFVEPLFVGYF